MLEEIAGEAKKHPAWIFLAVIVVAVLAYLQSKNQPQFVEASFAGGGAARAIDPQAAAIEEAAIGAGHSNVETLASLIATENTNQSALFGNLRQTSAELSASLASTEAGRTTSLAATEANRDASLASTEAGRATGLAQIAAALNASLASTAAQRELGLAGISSNQEISDAQTAAQLSISQGNNDTSLQLSQGNNATALQAAAISAQSAAQIAQINATTEAARLKAESASQNNANQTQKDIARASDNTGIITTLIHVAGGVLSFFGL